MNQPLQSNIFHLKSFADSRKLTAECQLCSNHCSGTPPAPLLQKRFAESAASAAVFFTAATAAIYRL